MPICFHMIDARMQVKPNHILLFRHGQTNVRLCRTNTGFQTNSFHKELKCRFCLLYSSWQKQDLSRPMTKPTKWLCAQRKLRSAWASTQSDQSLRYPHEKKLGSLATHWAQAKTDQTGRMPRLTWVFAGRKVILLVLSWGAHFCMPQSALSQTGRSVKRLGISFQRYYVVSRISETWRFRLVPLIVYEKMIFYYNFRKFGLPVAMSTYRNGRFGQYWYVIHDYSRNISVKLSKYLEGVSSNKQLIDANFLLLCCFFIISQWQIMVDSTKTV